MVELIAKAMFDCHRGYNAETQERMWQMARYGLMRQAERALVAMREPTREMVEAAANIDMGVPRADGLIGPASAVAAWRAMLMAATMRPDDSDSAGPQDIAKGGSND